MDAADRSPPAEVSRVAVRLPPFWAERPAVWFAQVEAQFLLAGVSSEKTKFFHVISQLDHPYAAEVEDIIISPPERDPYTTRAELVRRLTPSREQRIRQLLMLEMGDCKPSQFLRHLRSLAPDDFLSIIWSSRLPPTIKAHLTCQPECGLEAAARCADRITEVAPQPALASVTSTDNRAALNQEIEDFSRHVASLSAERDHLRASLSDPPLSSRDPRPVVNISTTHSYMYGVLFLFVTISTSYGICFLYGWKMNKMK
jgi:hypothetical protein